MAENAHILDIGTGSGIVSPTAYVRLLEDFPAHLLQDNGGRVH